VEECYELGEDYHIVIEGIGVSKLLLIFIGPGKHQR